MNQKEPEPINVDKTLLELLQQGLIEMSIDPNGEARYRLTEKGGVHCVKTSGMVRK